MFITFEGGEGVGKTTLIQHLKTYFNNKDMDVVVTREPGGTPKSEQIREILLNNPSLTNTQRIELFVEARIDHNKKVIKPALLKNKIVLCDRYFDSTFVYQGILIDQENFNMCVELNLSQDIEIPNLTFILDLDPVIAQQRLKSNQRETNFIDNKPLSYHQKLRQAYLDVADNKKLNFSKQFSCQETIVINVDQSLQSILNIIINEIETRL